MLLFQEQFNTISAEDSQSIASRQVLTFLRPTPREGGPPSSQIAPSKAAFSLSYLPEGALGERNQFPWKTRDLFDIHGNLLFRDQLLPLQGGNELRVRTAASSSLRTPVWSVKAGAALGLEALRDDAIRSLKSRAFVPMDDRLICYSYPRIGILCKKDNDSKATAVVDIGTEDIIPLDSYASQTSPEFVKTAWSPYDMVIPGLIGEFRETWNRNMEQIPDFPQSGGLEAGVTVARSGVEEQSVNPELILTAQETDSYCAVATGVMILRFHGITLSQPTVAQAMKTTSAGSTNDDQCSAYNTLSAGKLSAELDETASYDPAECEVKQNRPFKSGITGHARACGGYKIDGNARNFLYIYDPWPPQQGDIYYEDWSAVYHTNYIYVRSKTFA